MERIEKVVDCYLDLLVSAGPLGDVMQSEAARPGSPLGPQRRKTLDTLVAHFQAAAGAFDRRIDPLVFRTLLLAAESVCLQMRSSGQLNPAATKRVRLVLLRIAQATLAAGDDQVAGLPGS
jgi:hypothetical protein